MQLCWNTISQADFCKRRSAIGATLIDWAPPNRFANANAGVCTAELINSVGGLRSFLLALSGTLTPRLLREIKG